MKNISIPKPTKEEAVYLENLQGRLNNLYRAFEAETQAAQLDTLMFGQSLVRYTPDKIERIPLSDINPFALMTTLARNKGLVDFGVKS